MTIAADAQTRRAAATRAAELSDALALPPPPDPSHDLSPSSPRWRDQSLSKGAAGVAILHGVRAQNGFGDKDRVRAWLARATREDLSAGHGAGLWFGAPAVAFALTTAAPGQHPRAETRLDDGVRRLVHARLEAAHRRISAAGRPALSEFDLVRGITGIGAYLLRRIPDDELLRRVLSYLVRLTEPLPVTDAAGSHAPGWWTGDTLPGPPAAGINAGHANLGMAHGISGPLALLSLAIRQGITVAGHVAAIERICQWLDTWRQEGPSGPWWPERLTLDELRDGRSTQTGPARPSWCYGTPGLARAQQLAGIAVGEPSRQEAAEHALAQCLSDPVQLSRIGGDSALCHGWGGLTATAWCAAADARSPNIAAHLPLLLDGLIDRTHGLRPAPRPGLIEGSAGTALTLHCLATGADHSWLTCLLLN